MSKSTSIIEYNGKKYYGIYNGTVGLLRSQFYETEDENEEYRDKDDPRTPDKISIEMIERSELVDATMIYGSDKIWDVLFDPITKMVIFNNTNSYYNDEIERHSSIFGGYHDIEPEFDKLNLEDQMKFRAKERIR